MELCEDPRVTRDRGSVHQDTARNLAAALVGSGGDIAGVVYGTIVVMATLTAAYATEKRPWQLAAIVGATVVVLWVAHLYAHGLSRSINRRRQLRNGDLAALARSELGILLAGALPFAALVAGGLDVIPETTAVWLALGIGIVTLGAEGLRYARVERLGPTQASLIVCANLALGLVVVLMKVLLTHS